MSLHAPICIRLSLSPSVPVDPCAALPSVPVELCPALCSLPYSLCLVSLLSVRPCVLLNPVLPLTLLDSPHPTHLHSHPTQLKIIGRTKLTFPSPLLSYGPLSGQHYVLDFLQLI